MALSATTLTANLILRSNFAQVLGGAAMDLRSFRTALDSVGDKTREIGATITKNITLPIAGSAAAVAKAAIDYETAFSGVRKTVNGVNDAFGKVTALGRQISSDIRQMSRDIPITAIELAGVAEAAGQLGIETQHISTFTRTMADLGIATELTSEQAARGLAKIATITQMPQEQFDRLGSVINELETRFNAGADEIVEYGVRIASTASTAGLAEKDFLAFGSAAASVGIQAEAGGTALSKVFQNVFEAVKTGNSNLEVFAETAGMSADTFAKAFKDDAATAILQFVEGLGRIHKEGGNVFAVMKDVEFQDVRLKNAMLALSGAGDELRTQLAAARGEWEANTSLVKEAAIRYGTTASQVQVLWNWIKDLAVTLGTTLLPAINSAVALFKLLLTPVILLAQAYAALPTFIHQIVGAFVLLVAAIGPAVFLFGVLLSSAAALTGVLYALQVAWAILTGGVVKAPAVLRLVAFALDGVMTATGLSTTTTFTFKGALDAATASAGRYATALLGLARAQTAQATTAVITDPRRLLTGTVATSTTAAASATSWAGLGAGLMKAVTHPLESLKTVAGQVGGLFTWLGGVVQTVFGFFARGGGAVNLLTSALNVLRYALAAIVGVVGWPAILAGGLAYLVSLIPGVRGLFGDLAKIVLLLAQEAITALVEGLKWLWNGLTSTAGAVGSWVGTLVNSIPGVSRVIAIWKQLTGAVREYREALEKKHADAEAVTREDVHKLLPKSPSGMGQFATSAPMTNLQALASSFGYVGDMTDKASMELAILTGRMADADSAVKRLTPSMIAYVEKALQPGSGLSKDDIVKTLEGLGVNATVAAGAVDVLSDKAQANKQALDQARQAAETYRQKIADLAADLSGATAIAEAGEMFAALALAKRQGVTVWNLTAEAQARVNSVMDAAAKVYESQGKAIPENIRTVRMLTTSMEQQAEAAEKNRTALEKQFKPLTELWSQWGKAAESAQDARFKQLEADGDKFVKATAESRKAITELRAETEDFYAAAHALPFDALEARLGGVTVEYQRQRAEIEATAKDGALYAQHMAALAEKEAAARAKVTAEWTRALPMTKDMEAAQKRLEIQSLKATLAAYAYRAAWGDASVLQAMERIRLKIAQLEKEAAKLEQASFFDKWLPSLEKVSGVLGGWSKLIEGIAESLGGVETVAGRVFQTIAYGMQQVQQAVSNLSQFANATNNAERVAAIGNSAGSLWAATGTRSSAQNYAGGVTHGASTGAMIGTMVAPGIGTVVGAVIGMVVGGVIAAIRNNAEWRKVLRDMGRDWGLGMSDELAKAIAKVSKQIGRQDAPLLFLDKLFAENGGVGSAMLPLEKALQMTRQLFDAITRGTIDTKQASMALGSVFSQLAAEATKGGGIVSKQFMDIVSLSRSMGLNVKEVNEYLAKMTAQFSAAATKRVEAFFKAFDLDKIQKLKDALKDEAPEQEMGVEETRLRKELEQAQKRVFNTLGGDRATVQAEFQRMGLYAGVSFAETLKREGWQKAIEAAGPMFDQLNALSKEFGFQLEGAAVGFAAFYQTAKDNADVMVALEGLTGMIVGSANAMFLNQELFSAFGEDAVAQFTKLTERGVESNTALVLMQPTLQALWEAQDRFGLATDDATQKLIDQAREQGLVGEHAKDINERILGVLEKIAVALGATLPEATDRFRDSLGRLPKDIDINVNTDYTTTGEPPTLPDPPVDPGTDPATYAMGGRVLAFARGGRVPRYFDAGGLAADVVRFIPRGTDTVPAMLTPGEVVLNAAQQRNIADQLGGGGRGREDNAELARLIVQAFREAGAGGEAGVVVLQGDAKGEAAVEAILAHLPRSIRQNRAGIRTALRDALGIAS